MVAFVEEQVERAVDRRKPRGEVGGVRDLEQTLGTRECLLRAREAFLDRRARADEGAGNLVHAEAAQDVEHQRDLRRLREPRVAAGEHHAQLIVLDGVCPKQLLDGGRQLLVGLEQPAQLRRERACRALAPQYVDGAMLRGGHEPCGRIVRHPAKRPHLQRAAEGVLRHVFCQREVLDTEDARQRGDDPPRLSPEQMLVQLHHMPVFRTGRTSTTPPPSKMGQPIESSTASARSFASIRVYPPTMPLASAYAPSGMALLLPLTSLPA